MKPKNSKALQIIQSIRISLGELEGHISLDSEKAAPLGKRSLARKRQSVDYTGASGGIRMLIEEERYFKEPKSLPEVVVRLRQEGFNYRRNTISMALLRAVRNRILVRLPIEGPSSNEKWVYVIRK